MKGKWNLAAFVLGVLIFTGAAKASVTDAESNPYRVISQHSVFGLVPPQPVATTNATDSPPDIVLNGIMVIFDRKYALFKLPANKGKSYLLGEGQSDGEIELLSVDDRAGLIKINNHGVVQTVALAKPPAPSVAPAAASAADVANNPQPVSAEGIPQPVMENNPAPSAAPAAPAGYAVAFAGGSGNSQGSSSGSTSSDGSSGSQSSGGSNSTAKATPDPWWVVASKNLEAARAATAGLVDSGQADPFPLTPFTPPGTPANLIGPGQLYFVSQAN
jgi:uncharacterized membrane protein YgcG